MMTLKKIKKWAQRLFTVQKTPPYMLTLKQAWDYPREVGNKAHSLSRIIYNTLDPMDMCEGECLAIFAVPGFGSRLVDGTTNPDVFLVSRHDPTCFLDRQPADENSPPPPKDGVKNGPKDLCLDDKSATVLAKWGFELESLNKMPHVQETKCLMIKQQSLKIIISMKNYKKQRTMQ